MINHQSLRNGLLWYFREHVPVLFFYIALSIAVTWPVIRNFTTHFIGDGGDARHHLWVIWHTKEAILGRDSLFYTKWLFYPEGISLQAHSLGIVAGIFSLPFWVLGTEAAYNGSILVGLCLNGYFMYLLARGFHMHPLVALFAGTTLLMAPISLAAVIGLTEMVFLGGMALVLLAFNNTINPERSYWWAVITSVSMLFVLLHSSFQFVFTCLAIGFFAITKLIHVYPKNHFLVIKRVLLAGILTILLTSPLFVGILTLMKDPRYPTNIAERWWYEVAGNPDLLQFFLPHQFSLLWGTETRRILSGFSNIAFTPETTVSLSYSMIGLLTIAVLIGRHPGRLWALFTFLFILFAMGPFFKIGGQIDLLNGKPIYLPYALLNRFPGFGVLRFPSRFMAMGYIGLGITASFGLERLIQWKPFVKYIFPLLAALVLFVEVWPTPYPLEKLPAVPDFYRTIAQDPETYGILDLPMIDTWVPPSLHHPFMFEGWGSSQNSMIFEMYQMTHRKGISQGYISRMYRTHPVLSDFMNGKPPIRESFRVNGSPANGYINLNTELARLGYRYVVWHKKLFYDQGFYQKTEVFLQAVFGSKKPIVDDEELRVYKISPNMANEELSTTLRPHENWRGPEKSWEWAVSPATIWVESSKSQPAVINITPAFIHDPQSDNGLGTSGKLKIQMDSGFSVMTLITVGQTSSVPILLTPGRHLLTLTLEAGNFQPSDYGFDDFSELSFAVNSINLQEVNVNSSFLIQ